MKTGWIAIALAGLLAAGAAQAAGGHTYQVTGPVVDVSPTSITVKKGKEDWTIARDASTKVSAEPKKGEKVTVHYTMTATEIESKAPAAAPAKTKKK